MSVEWVSAGDKWQMWKKFEGLSSLFAEMRLSMETVCAGRWR